MTRNVLVTGGTRGLGLGVSTRLAEAGFNVVAVARRSSEAFEAARRGACAGRLHHVAFDLADCDAIPDLATSLRGGFGHFYGLVNNAATGASGVLAMVSVEQIRRQVELNVTSPIILSKHLTRSMMAGGGGRIVNIASIVASNGFSGLSVYSATKAALVGFTKSLAREVGRLDVTVNAVAPGFLDTEMTQSLTGAERDKIARRSALRRMPGVADVANTVAFLMSEEARNVTGVVLTVDAGATA